MKRLITALATTMFAAAAFAQGTAPAATTTTTPNAAAPAPDINIACSAISKTIRAA